MIAEPPIFCVFTSGRGFANRILGDTIQLFEGGIKVNHAAHIYWNVELCKWMTVGANANGVTEMPLEAFAAERNLVHMFGAAGGWSLWDGLRAHVSDIGKHYNYSGLFGMAIVEIAEKLGRHPQHNLLNDREDVFCSEWQDEIIDSGLAKSGMLAKWPLARTDAAIIDPAQLCAAEIASPLFSTQHNSVLSLSWSGTREI